ncbi:selenium-dependent xanthine dehydrogenase [Intestinimonas butyriciproducens]|uniref:selenium-dependent xanthine dehydrogenase n=1 Tax=Intestinimonas butyriciproducens TaxID=1297617 RepID=UPI0008202522|nr:selenium-dependent xanthine dehydrogenase [Intestinimonas butyriciproducens]SCJ21790.1 Aldehyde oxidoreductase [uncultured Clostridium sp.]MBU5230849.1 selenium-dependent xanthine dehydrogenase [Intestinimonas butyriciproducens]MCI6362506.1 selenium-dependent xanthine dehydrogenase [Intestinimonas butyriciproducens]MDB7831510.1 selenium-dependent xanthine dehydrogenase [Intestinimonas butyriciproducens]MDB7861619.1 selenium-dependent xanthine dehydrogenase [Intestinimonas butyriciproducens]
MGESYTFTVNGILRETEEEKPLLRYLRDDLHLTSVKDGCSEGACGTCTIVVDGKAVRSCILTTKKAVGKHILTVEGLTEAEQETFVYAFGAVGAVQCGFCIPGMVLSGKALLDQNPDPSEDEIKKAIRGNVCRCTGYKKIIEGISLAGAILRGERTVDPALERGERFGVGERAFRSDVRDKVLGRGEYCDDVALPGMVHASAVRSEYPRARVLDIDASAALALPGVLAVLTAEDVPHNKVGHIQQDWDVMIARGDVTRCVGDAVCLVVAETETALAEAKKLVKVTYEPLSPVRTIQEAMAEDAPRLHPNGNLCQSRHVTRGDAKAALANSRYVVTQNYRTPFTEHAFLEPECAVAFPYENGVKVYTSDQGVYDTRKEIAIMLGWEPERIVVENKLVGGGFGGKEDVSVQHIAVLAALKVGRPVKVKFSRKESIAFHPKRHYMEGTFTLGCDENGIFTGLDCEIYFDTGAYASLCGPVLERACTHSVGPYCYQNTDIRGYGYYTNNPPAGAFRGFGVCQSEFALESNINLLAEQVGISPWEIRYRNAIEPGKVLPNGQIADCSTALKETLEAVREAYEQNAGHAGIACAMKNTGVGVGLPDKGRARLEVRGGVVEIYAAASDIGQGCATVFLQILSEATGLRREQMRNMGSSSELAPDSGTTSGSRQTLITGEAVRIAAADLKKALDGVGGDLSALEGREFFAEFFDPTDKLGADKPNPKSHVAYGFATHVVVLDDDGRVKEVWAAHDSGKVVNPISIQGQIEGGVLMGLGYALTEDFPLKDCVPQAKFGTLGLMRADQIPDIHAIYVEKKELLPFAYGAKGIGEIATIPTAPAVQGAYYARDHVLRTALPMQDTFYRPASKGK